MSIGKKLSSLYNRLSLVEILLRGFTALRESLDLSQQQVQMMATENATLGVGEIPHRGNDPHFQKEQKNKRNNLRTPGSQYKGQPGVFWMPGAGG